MSEPAQRPTNMLGAAQWFHRNGFDVIAVHRVGGSMKMCTCSRAGSCKSAGKHPIGNEWQSAPPMSAADVQATWDVTRPPNIGIRTGPDLLVLDVDPEGMGWLQQMVAEHGLEWGNTLKVTTGRGGMHLYFRPTREHGNTAGKIAPGIDTRGVGGFVVAPPSVSGKGEYVLHPEVVEVAPIPAWLEELLPLPAPEQPTPDVAPTGAVGEPTAAAVPAADVVLDVRETSYLRSAYEGELARLDVMKMGATENGHGYTGPPWDTTCFQVAANLIEIANTGLVHEDLAWQAFAERAPSDRGFTLDDHKRIWGSAHAKVAGSKRSIPAPTGPTVSPEVAAFAWTDDDPFSPHNERSAGQGAAQSGPDSNATQSAAPPVAGPRTGGLAPLDVGNVADMADWLQANLGKGALSGIYLRSGDEVVHTPRIGEDGYIPLSKDEAAHDGPAQIRILGAKGVRAHVQFSFWPYKAVKKPDGGSWNRHETFPIEAADIAVAAPHHMHALPRLAGVVHTPTIRPDGSLIEIPGYDEATGLLYLPTPGLTVPSVPAVPSLDDVNKARGWLDFLLHGFDHGHASGGPSWVTPEDRMNYLGALLTPMIRELVPAPFKMLMVESHSPGSGKTLLASALVALHGGVMRSELPRDEAEIGKVITSILDVTTGPVVVFDNVAGLLSSPKLAGLLTSGTWSDRRLGSTSVMNAKNDRLWVVTGNNIAIAGDMARRMLRVKIDPGVPNPENRTGFAVPDLHAWVQAHRGELLWALLVLVRNWIAGNRPMDLERGSDSYRVWSGTVGGILQCAGWPGRFNDPALSVEATGVEDDDWGSFLSAAHSVFGLEPFLAKQLLEKVDDGLPLPPGSTSVYPIPYDALPSALVERRRGTEPLHKLSKSLGRFLMNRHGRWAGGFTVRPSHKTNAGQWWKIETIPSARAEE